ncbi:hypothetical protein BGZ80_009881 [Entomortierella chlamydospora]|uniref:Uncharacterized protein n=1 Tax=Entomortierella chlamydospora TaxID=101097 RepID=A0A9P6MWJ7_9FUNG|nr:hypothetical protein BGZ80_009881 [Entomortierella chlamydospora]
MATAGPQSATQLHSLHQKRYSRMENEPETPVPSSYPPLIPVPIDTIKQSALLNSIDTTIDRSVHRDNNGPTSELVSEPSSPSPPVLLHNTDLQASLQYLPDLASSPAKMNHLQGLMSSLHKIMNDQNFVLGDLRTQLDEIQDILNRVGSKQDSMSAEERKIIQNAQMLKSLAEDVIATNLTSESKKSIEEGQGKIHPLTISVPTPGARTIDSTETPPPTAITPPPGHLRHRSSTASFASSVSSDRQYTPDGEERTSRPSSVASSYRSKQKKKSLRQLEPLTSNRGSRYDVESNASFDRICSLLTELITDASTAVSTAPDGTQQPSTIPLPQLPSLEPSESESDSASDQDEDGDDSNNTLDSVENTVTTKETDDPFLKRLQVPESAQSADDAEVEVELEPVDRYRTGFRSRPDKSSKRLSSLFMELQNTQTIQGAAPKDEPAKEKVVRRPRRSISSMSISSTRSSRHNSVSLRSNESIEPLCSFESPLESPLITERIKQRNSISSIRSEPLQKLSARSESPVKQDVVDPELNRTVETIDGLTRDLVTVATHQNLMQMKLQKTLQFQKEQIQQIERAHSPSAVSLTRGVDEPHLDKQSDQRLLADLSRSLKQVAVSVGKVLANSASKAHRGGQSKEGQKELLENTEKPATQRVSRFSGKDFSQYFQELEKVAALGGRIGFGHGDVDGALKDHILEGSTDQHGKSGSAKSPNGSCRNSSAILVEEALVPVLDEPDVVLHSGSSSPKVYTTVSSRRGSVSAGPPDLEDFAAQCRLLTRALVLPFIQLTHHAMTSQDSAFALNPRSSKFSGPARDLDSTLEIVEDLDISTRENRPISPKFKPVAQKDSDSIPSLPGWSPSMTIAGRDLDSILKANEEMSPDAIVKAKTFISTGLYLLHLLYWTVLFVIGTVVLDSWLAETAGTQVVRIVDQVREAIAKEDPSGQRFHPIDQALYLQERENLITSDQRDPEAESILERGRLQAHEDRAIEVAVGFESLKNRLSGARASDTSSQSFKSPWNKQGNFQSTAAALTAATLSESKASSSSAEVHGKSPAHTTVSSNTGVLRTVSWVGPRKRRNTKDGVPSRVRRFSNTRTMTLTGPLLKTESVSTTVVPRRLGSRQDRPLSHWGSFGPTSVNTLTGFVSTDFTSQGLGNASQRLQIPQNVPKQVQVRRKSF